MEYILGIIVSLIAQISKEKLSQTGTLVLVFLLSILASVAYFFLIQNETIYNSFVQIMVTAGAFHNFIIRRFNE